MRTLAIALALIFCAPLAAFAEVPHPYDKLNLNPNQAERIQNLDQDWRSRLKNAQNRLVELLSTPKSDPLEITSQQQRVNQLKEQLSEQATANYLRKRSLLNTDQQRQLEGLLKRMVAERSRNKL
jgi:exonuclease VII large subunit